MGKCPESKREREGTADKMGIANKKMKESKKRRMMTVEGRERGVNVCIRSAAEENCLTVIERSLNDNLLSSLRCLLHFLSFLGEKNTFFS